MTVFLRLYALATRALTPFIRAHIRARAQKGKEDPARLNERFGQTTAPAFMTPPLWIHAASVGEALSALSLIPLLRDIRPDLPVLLTTGTITSARVLTGRLPPNTTHQYAPYDHPAWIERFLNHWHPFAALRMESELWPNTLRALSVRRIPIALLNARISEKSTTRWQFFPRTIRALLSRFTLVLADGMQVKERLARLGLSSALALPNLKFLATSLGSLPALEPDLIAHLSARPVWLYASTHADEEQLAAQIHKELKSVFPHLLTLVAPRHPERRDSIAAALAGSGLTINWRSKRQIPADDTDLYMIDTMGELFSFYAYAPVALIGRSFSRDGGGGHNPIEPALMKCYPLSGPDVQNLDTIFDTMIQAGAAEILPDVPATRARLSALLADLETLKQKGESAQAFVLSCHDTLADQLRGHLANFLKTERARS